MVQRCLCMWRYLHPYCPYTSIRPPLPLLWNIHGRYKFKRSTRRRLCFGCSNATTRHVQPYPCHRASEGSIRLPPAIVETGSLSIRQLISRHQMTLCQGDVQSYTLESQTATTVSSMMSETETCGRCKRFDRRCSICAWPGQVNAWENLAVTVSGQRLSTRRMRFELLPVALARDQLP